VPVQPLVEGGHRRGAEDEAVLARLAQVREDDEALGETEPPRQLGGVVLAQHQLARGAVGVHEEVFLVQVAAAEHLEPGDVVLDEVVAGAAAEHQPQVELLERVVLQVRDPEHAEAVRQKDVVARPAVDRLGRRLAFAPHLRPAVERADVQGSLVPPGLADGVGAQGEGEGVGVAGREAQAGVGKSAPQVQQARVAVAFRLSQVQGLFGFVADGLEGGAVQGHRAGLLRGDLEVGARRRHGPRHGLPVGQSQVQRLVGLDGGDLRHGDGDVAHGLGLQRQRRGVGLDDGAGDPVAVRQGDDVGGRGAGQRSDKDQQHCDTVHRMPPVRDGGNVSVHPPSGRVVNSLG